MMTQGTNLKSRAAYAMYILHETLDLWPTGVSSATYIHCIGNLLASWTLSSEQEDGTYRLWCKMIKTVSESSNYRLASEHYQIRWCKNKWRKDWTYNFQDSRLKLTLKLIRWMSDHDWLVNWSRPRFRCKIMDYDLLGFKSSIQSSCRYFLFFFSSLFMRKHSAAVSRSLTEI